MQVEQYRGHASFHSEFLLTLVEFDFEVDHSVNWMPAYFSALKTRLIVLGELISQDQQGFRNFPSNLPSLQHPDSFIIDGALEIAVFLCRLYFLCLQLRLSHSVDFLHPRFPALLGHELDKGVFYVLVELAVCHSHGNSSSKLAFEVVLLFKQFEQNLEVIFVVIGCILFEDGFLCVDVEPPGQADLFVVNPLFKEEDGLVSNVVAFSVG